MNYLEEVYQFSPVEIREVLPLRLAAHGFSAAYYNKAMREEGCPHIEYRSDLTEEEKLLDLVHEVGHAVCDKNDCRCMRSTKYKWMREYHAAIFSLKWWLKRKDKRHLKLTIEDIKIWRTYSIHNGIYQKATKKVVKLKLWQKCLNFIGDI